MRCSRELGRVARSAEVIKVEVQGRKPRTIGCSHPFSSFIVQNCAVSLAPLCTRPSGIIIQCIKLTHPLSPKSRILAFPLPACILRSLLIQLPENPRQQPLPEPRPLLLRLYLPPNNHPPRQRTYRRHFAPRPPHIPHLDLLQPLPPHLLHLTCIFNIRFRPVLEPSFQRRRFREPNLLLRESASSNFCRRFHRVEFAFFINM